MPPLPARPGLQGHLELVCGLDGRGQSALRRQSFRAPVHLGKSYADATPGGALAVQLVNPTAGLLEGDRVRLDVRVEAGARLRLTTPSASRLHAMRAGWAEGHQAFHVAAGASLEYWPEMLLPQAGARYRQQTLLTLETGAELLFLESVAPGRVASGEAFAFEELRFATDLRLGGRLLARERARLVPGDDSLAALRRQFPAAYWASVWRVTPEPAAGDEDMAALHALQAADVWIGVTALAANVRAARIVTADSLALRRVLGAVREAWGGPRGRGNL